ncbi:MAG TPA: permease-like cell division protein FtsX [Terriglobales bacterium]|nr:permease-like cell division protein FtsX [Terriglobales bacterium]
MHVYFLREAWRSFRQHQGLAWTAVVSLTATLLLCAVFLLLTNNARRAVRFIGDRREMVVYLRDDVSPALRDSLIGRLTVLYGAVTYVSKQQAWDEFSQQVGDPQLLQAVDQNPLPASLRVRLRPELLNYSAMEQAAKQVQQFPEVEDVRYGGEWVRRLDELQATLTRDSLAVGVVVALAILLVIYNTIRLSVMTRRREVEIMIRLGASDRFIATPLTIEAVGQTLLAALIALSLLFAVQQLALQQVARVTFLPPWWLAGFVGGAVLLAWIAASVAVARALRSAGP